jgi:formamidopyrimidine-DNA glycosylase
MFELPELVTLARQINQNLTGKTISNGSLGNSPHKFVWYNRKPEEFADITRGKTIGEAKAKGRWLFVPVEPGYVLLLGEFGGKLLLHPAGAQIPKKYHLLVAFTDDTFLSAMTQMWGAMELYEAGKEQERQYVKNMKPTPLDPEFTYPYFTGLIDSLLEGEKRSAKGLLTQDQIIPGLGNAIAQDILFTAGLHPRRPIAELDDGQRRVLYDSIIDTVNEIISKGGRNDEFDLFEQPGNYMRLMDSKAPSKPCPKCNGSVEKMQYLGGACYFCPNCQK